MAVARYWASPVMTPEIIAEIVGPLSEPGEPHFRIYAALAESHHPDPVRSLDALARLVGLVDRHLDPAPEQAEVFARLASLALSQIISPEQRTRALHTINGLIGRHKVWRDLWEREQASPDWREASLHPAFGLAFGACETGAVRAWVAQHAATDRNPWPALALALLAIADGSVEELDRWRAELPEDGDWGRVRALLDAAAHWHAGALAPCRRSAEAAADGEDRISDLATALIHVTDLRESGDDAAAIRLLSRLHRVPRALSAALDVGDLVAAVARGYNSDRSHRASIGRAIDDAVAADLPPSALRHIAHLSAAMGRDDGACAGFGRAIDAGADLARDEYQTYLCHQAARTARDRSRQEAAPLLSRALELMEAQDHAL